MDQSQRNVLLVIGALLLVALVFYAGFATGSNPRFNAWASSMYAGMMGGVYDDTEPDYPGYGMMGDGYGGMMGGGYGGMMGSSYGGMMGGSFGSGMMGAYGADVDPLSLEQAENAVQDYLADLDVDGLSLGEIMIFDNHAYAQVLEADSGIGAFELLIDPVTYAAYPEHGPNMMWNLKYNLMGAGMMDGGYDMMGMMMGGGYGMMEGVTEPYVFDNVSAQHEISPEEAISLASAYLADNLPDYSVADEADAFYGYYTLHILKDSQIAGMLSVNGFNGQVFLHTWHGEFIDMSHE